jgi:nucleotide-binding universal stress UspA family protein
MPGILVGVDGSDQSHRALAWAMHEACPVTVVSGPGEASHGSAE